MNFLEERIVKDGVVKPGNVLKVDSFLNHQMDIALMEEIGKEFKRRFADNPITKVLTIEASGIGIAAFVAKEFGVPLIFAKKSWSKGEFPAVPSLSLQSSLRMESSLDSIQMLRNCASK